MLLGLKRDLRALEQTGMVDPMEVSGSVFLSVCRFVCFLGGVGEVGDFGLSEARCMCRRTGSLRRCAVIAMPSVLHSREN